MTSPHQGVPWHSLTKHIFLDAEGNLIIRHGSKRAARLQDYVYFAKGLTSKIVAFATSQRQAIPNVTAPIQEWETALNMRDNKLFDAISMKDDDFQKIQRWEKLQNDDLGAARMVERLIGNEMDPFEHLPTLVYLAQHSRVKMSCLRSIFTFAMLSSDPGLDQFGILALQEYIYVNLLLGINKGETLTDGRAVDGTRGCNVDVFGENIHTSFWKGVPCLAQSPSACALYSRQCFDIAVAWYIIIKEAEERDIAVGLKTSRFEPISESSLTLTVLQALEKVSPVFHIPALRDHPESIVPQIRPLSVTTRPDAVSNAGHSRRRSRPQSRFVQLPEDIHLEIASHLPARSLFAVVELCRQLRDIITPLIYHNPFQFVSWPTRIPVDGNNFLKVAAILNARPDLQRHLRRAIARMDSLPLEVSSNVLYPPLRFILGLNVQNITSLVLIVDENKYDGRIFSAPHLEALLSQIGRRWPKLPCLELHPSSKTRPQELSANEQKIDFPRLLTKLTCAPFYSPIAFTLATLSAPTLRILSLEGNRSFISETTNILALPIFPSVHTLSIGLDVPPQQIETLLQRCFPAVKTLEITNCSDDGWAHEGPGIRFSTCAPHVTHMKYSNYSILSTPPSLSTVVMDRIPLLQRSAAPLVEAVLIKDSFRGLSTLEAIALAEAFPNLQFLELNGPMTKGDLSSHLLSIPIHLPNLRYLIVSVRSLTYRPRRVDVPESIFNDGIDALQREYAEAYFLACSKLEVVSFNGIPDVWDEPGNVPGRVWIRQDDISRSHDSEAKMAGRWAIPYIFEQGT